jgi:hypothetical protein
MTTPKRFLLLRELGELCERVEHSEEDRLQTSVSRAVRFRNDSETMARSSQTCHSKTAKIAQLCFGTETRDNVLVWLILVRSLVPVASRIASSDDRCRRPGRAHYTATSTRRGSTRLECLSIVIVAKGLLSYHCTRSSPFVHTRLVSKSTNSNSNVIRQNIHTCNWKCVL